MKITIGWINKANEVDLQTKNFEDVTMALQWCRQHDKNIASINGVLFKYCFGGIVAKGPREMNHFEIMAAINGVSN